MALRQVIQANDGMTKLSADIDVSRESLYKSLSENGNPNFATVSMVLASLGMKFSIAIGNITISGNNNPFNAVQAGGDVIINQSQTQTKVTNPDLQAALEALGQLKKAIATTDEMDETEEAMAAIPIQKLEAELQKPQPDRSMVDRLVATLKKALDGVITLAEPVTKVATLVAKAWAGLP